MEQENYWAEGPQRQWIFYAGDNSSLEGLSEKIDPGQVFCPEDAQAVNLGIRRVKGRLYAGNYVGLCRLKGINGRNLTARDGREVILKVRPRFPLSAVDLLNIIREDDEFDRYLAPQTTRIGAADREVEDLIDNELFHFFTDEDPIFIQDEIAQESSMITASVFISLLRSLCSRPLMGRTVSREENLTGKARGRIVFSRNIRHNTLRGRDDRLYCRYLQYSEDILENQILKAALKKADAFLSRYFFSVSGGGGRLREMAVCCKNALSHVSYRKITRFDLSGIRTTGVYVSYKPVISAAKMVLNEITLEANGNTAATSYVIPYAVSMEKLFEMYVRSYLKKAGVYSFDSREEGLRMARFDEKTAVLRERDKSYANYIRGNIKPDIVIYHSQTGRRAVFDVKYKDPSGARFSRADRLQILAYGLMFDCEHVGNIFPSRGGNICYHSNGINSSEEKARYYHQLELAVDGSRTFRMYSELDKSYIEIMDYLHQLLG